MAKINIEGQVIQGTSGKFNITCNTVIKMGGTTFKDVRLDMVIEDPRVLKQITFERVNGKYFELDFKL